LAAYPYNNEDVGIDGEIELGKGGTAIGHLIKVQVKEADQSATTILLPEEY